MFVNVGFASEALQAYAQSGGKRWKGHGADLFVVIGHSEQTWWFSFVWFGGRTPSVLVYMTLAPAKETAYK
jgi:hypothetical protein